MNESRSFGAFLPFSSCSCSYYVLPAVGYVHALRTPPLSSVLGARKRFSFQINQKSQVAALFGVLAGVFWGCTSTGRDVLGGASGQKEEGERTDEEEGGVTSFDFREIS